MPDAIQPPTTTPANQPPTLPPPAMPPPPGSFQPLPMIPSVAAAPAPPPSPTPTPPPLRYQPQPGTPLSSLLGLPQRQPDYLTHLQVTTQDTDPKQPGYAPERLEYDPSTPAGYLIQLESGGKRDEINPIETSSGHAQSYYQITTGTWDEFAPKVGVDLRQYPEPRFAPYDVQTRVARVIPMSRWSTLPVIQQRFPWVRGDMTFGQVTGAVDGQRYLPAEQTPNLRYRGPDQWGKSPEGGYAAGSLPKPNDIPGIMATLKKFYPILSDDSAIGQAAMMRAVAGYMQGYQQGQLGQVQLEKEQLGIEIARHNQQMTEENTDIGSAMVAYGDDTNKLSQALSEIADRNNDNPLRVAIDHGADAVKRLMQWRDHYNTDLAKTQLAMDRELRAEQQFELQQRSRDIANEIAAKRNEILAGTEATTIAKAKAELAALQQRKEEVDRRQKALQDYGLPEEAIPKTPQKGLAAPEEATPPTGTPQADTGETAPGPQGAATQAPQPAATAQAAPAAPAPGQAAADRPYQVASLGDVAPPTRPPSALPTAQAAYTPQTPAEADTQYLLHGGDPSNLRGTDPAALAYDQAQAAKIRARLNDQLFNSPNSGAAFINDLRQVDQGTANRVQQLIDRKGGSVGATGLGNRTSEWNQLLSQLAWKADPTWNPNYDQAQKEWLNPGAVTARLIGRSNSMIQSAAQVLEYAGKLEKLSNPDIASRWAAYLDHKLAGDPNYRIYSSLFQAWQKFVIDSNVIATGSASGSVTETQAQVGAIMEPPRSLREIPPTASAIRDAVRLDTESAKSKLDAAQEIWNRIGSRTNGQLDIMFGMVPDIPAAINAITSMDPDTGAFTVSPVPPALQRAVPFDPHQAPPP